MKKCSMQKKKESLTRRVEALEDESESVQTMVRELAEETGNSYEEAEVDGSGAPDNGILVTFGSEEYYCYPDYDTAEAAAVQSAKDLLDDIGIDGINFDFIGGIEQFVDASWFEDAQRELAEGYVYDIKESDPERYEDEFGDLPEEDAVEKYLEDSNPDAIQWFIDEFGSSEFNSVVRQNNLVDYDALAGAIVDADGPEHELSAYDGREISLPCGYYCYRHN